MKLYLWNILQLCTDIQTLFYRELAVRNWPAHDWIEPSPSGPQLPMRLSEWFSLLWIGIYPEWWAGFQSSSLPLSRISRWIVLSSFQDRIYPNPFPLSQPVSSRFLACSVKGTTFTPVTHGRKMVIISSLLPPHSRPYSHQIRLFLATFIFLKFIYFYLSLLQFSQVSLPIFPLIGYYTASQLVSLFTPSNSFLQSLKISF